MIGTGIYKDIRDTNASRRFKVLGGGVATAWDENTGLGGGGVCSSPDGLTFSQADCIAWQNIRNMHWDSCACDRFRHRGTDWARGGQGGGGGGVHSAPCMD